MVCKRYLGVQSRTQSKMVHRAGVALIAKICVNIAFFGCRTHFSHIAASPYAKMTTPIKQVMAYWWMPRHSTLDLLANSVSSQPFKSVNEGRNLDSEINA